jgi:sugar phosphate isomerase/epimerase
VFAASAATVFASKETLKAGAQTNAWKVGVDDFDGLLKVLGHISALGFEGFETGFQNVQPVFGKKAKEAKEQIAATGLRFLGCHIQLGDDYDAKTNIPPIEQIIEVADGVAALGAERLILSGAPVAEGSGVIDAQRMAWKSGALDRAGRHCYDLKLRVCYHNHVAEFANGGEEMQSLMRDTDADNVHFIIDAGDAMRAKADIAGFFSKNHKRIDGFHMTDFDKDGRRVPLGKGVFQYEPLAIAIRKLKWTGWMIAEENRANGDPPGDAAVRPAREEIRRVFGV